MRPRRDDRAVRAGKAPLLLLAAVLALGLGVLLLVLARPEAGEGALDSGRALPDRTTAAAGGAEGRGAAAAGSAGGPAQPRLGPGAGRAAALETGPGESGSEGVPALERPWSGRVIERATDRPLEGARVLLRNGGLEVEATTDAAGAFELWWSADAPAEAEVTCAGHAPARRPRVALDEPGTFRLDRSATLAGRLLGPGPAEMAQARVHLWNVHAGGPRGERLESAVGADGRFAFTELEPSEYSLAAQAPGRGMGFAHRRALAAGERADVVLELARSAALRGRVLLEGVRTPVAGARIEVRPERQGVWGAVERLFALTAESAEDGSYVVEGLSGGRSNLVVRAPWGTEQRVQLDVSEGGEALERDLFLGRPASVAGTVVDERGAGVAGALVQAGAAMELFVAAPASEDGRAAGDRFQVRCDARGAFRFEALPCERALRVVAVARDVGAASAAGDGSGPLSLGVELRLKSGEERGGLRLTLRAPLRLRGRVTRADGTPLADARVLAHRRVGQRSGVCALDRTGQDGGFELAGLLAGEHVVEADHRDFLRARETVVLDHDAAPELVLALEAPLTVRGLVVDGDGDGVGFALVRASCPELAGDGAQRDPGVSARSDAHGRFHLMRLQPGRWLLAASAYGHVPDGGETWVALPGESFAVLELARKTPQERASVRGQVVVEDGSPPRELRFDDTRGGALDLDGGRFLLSGVRPGPLTLTVRAAGCVALRVGPLDLAPGAEVDLGLIELLRGTRLSVQVADAAGAPLRGARVRLAPLPEARGGLGQGARAPRLVELRPGRYVADGVRRATWRLRVERPGFRRHERSLEVRELPAQAVRVVLEKGGG